MSEVGVARAPCRRCHTDQMSRRPDLLPRGRHGMDPAYVASHQRARMLVAIAEVAAQRGYPETSVVTICKRAAISKGAFYEQFSSREDCFLAAFDASLAELREATGAACAREAEWGVGVRAGLGALAGWLSEHPPQARLLLLESLRAGPAALRRRQDAVDGFAPGLARSAPRLAAPASRRLLDRAVAGGIAHLLARPLLAGERDLRYLLPLMTEFALTPYLGPAEARRIAAGGGSG